MPYACQRCGLDVPQGLNVCPNCGATAQRPEAIVRCRNCYRRAPSHLSICPQCGRKLVPWRPDAPVAIASIVSLILLWLIFRSSGGPSAGAELSDLLTPATATAQTVAKLAAESTQATPAKVRAIPAKSPLFVNPTPTFSPPPSTSTTAPTPTDTPTASVITGTTVLTLTTAISGTVVAEGATVVATAVASATGGPSPTVQAVASPTPKATSTPSPVPTATATSVPSATPTPLPSATPTNAPTATATTKPGASPTTYVVKAGDTLGLIAQSVGRTVGAMAAYNNLTDVRRLAVGQVLQIPPSDYTPPAPTPTKPQPTPTVTPTPAPADAPTPAISIAAPLLVTPGDGAAFAGGNALIEFKWKNPGYFPAEGQNVIHIGVVSAPGVVEWRLNEPVGSATDFKAPSWLAGQAPTEFGRTYVWYVDVQSGGVPVSPPSSQWRFQWN